jgi:hypothetical protein
MSLTLAQARLNPNHLLGKLNDEHLRGLLPRLEAVEISIKQVLYERNQPIQFVYFPCSCGISNLIYLKDGAAIEVGTVGNEGCSTVEMLSNAALAIETGICQIAGKSMRMTANDFRAAIKGPTALRHVAECYLQGYLLQVSQSVACNRGHSIEQRFARWLLLSHDRVRGDEFYLTQEFIADMLGVQRPSVSVVAAAFSKAGMIEYSRGHMKITDRAALEKKTCECYGVVRDQFKRVFGIPYG